jgi:hypothetical protein
MNSAKTISHYPENAAYDIFSAYFGDTLDISENKFYRGSAI